MRVLIIISTLFFAGCAELGARFITNATYLAESSEGFIRETHDDRRWIRAMCRDIRRAQVMALQAEGRYDEALAALEAQYPPLVTFQMVQSTEETGDPYGVLNRPWPCRQNVPTSLPEETISPPVNLLEPIKPIEIPSLNLQTGLLEYPF